MDVRRFEPSFTAAWNAHNRSARNGHFLFDRGFMTYHADRFGDCSLVISVDDQIRGIFPANRAGNVIYSHQGLTFGGLVVDTAGTAEVLAMLDACIRSWHADGAAKLIYKPLPWIYHREKSQDDLYWLFHAGARLFRRDASVAISSASPGELSRRRERGARKARVAGVRLGRSTDYESYWRLLTDVLGRRHGVAPVHSCAEISLLASRFPENISLHLALGRDDEILAGVVLFSTDQVAHAQYIAASEAGRAVGALDFLFTDLIQSEGGQRAYFDFGISTEQSGRILNEGLIRQKEEFGASTIVHEWYELDFAA